MLTVEQRKILIETALGHRPLDLIVNNVKVVNVYTGSVENGSLGIKDGFMVTTNAAGMISEDATDGNGFFAMPGFIDTHVHLDSSLVTPDNLAELIVPFGTTAVFADPMESANVGGLQGLQALLQSSPGLPYHLFIEISSRVPTAPDLETTGGELNLADVQSILKWETCISLGELDPSKVLGLREEYIAKVVAAQSLGKIANGHAAGLSGRALEAYACGGLADDHESLDFQEAFARLRLGMPVLVREGSTERNLENIIKGVVEERLDTRHLMYCTDDKHPDDILREGNIDYMVNRSIALGIPPVQAIQMASLNAALHFRMDHLIGSLSPGRWADFILAKDLHHVVPWKVFFKGNLVAQEGELLTEISNDEYPQWFYKTVNVTRGNNAEDFILSSGGKTRRVRVIEISPDQIINAKGEAALSVIDGDVMVDINQDVLKIAVVERYGKNGNIGISFVKGFGLKRGALASSVAHDHHNIIVVGANNNDMALCVQAIQSMQGGLAIAAGGDLLGTLPLPLGGLMSDRPVKEVIASLEEITQIYHGLGGGLHSPFMTVSFISLPTVPQFGLTDKGLVEVREHRIISPFVNE